MAKSKKRQKESKKSSQVGTGDSALGHNPFGALSKLGGSLPQAVSRRQPQARRLQIRRRLPGPHRLQILQLLLQNLAPSSLSGER